MRVLTADTHGIQAAISILRNGGVVAHATETCYGLACDLKNPDAVAKLFRIKQRPAHQPVSALFSSVDEAKQYVEWNDRAEELAMKYLPGPLTMILPIRMDAPHQLFIYPSDPHPPAPSFFKDSTPPPPGPLPPDGERGRAQKENIFRSYRPSTIVNARGLRSKQTGAETILWGALRKNQFHGLHFRRQHPVGKYVLDFFCDSIALGIEIDGSVHDQAGQKERDADRTLYMKEAGIRIIRIKNNEVETDIQDVLLKIEKTMNSLPPLPSRAKRGMGEGVRGWGLQEQKGVGVRISSHPLAMQLIKEFGSPLSTTSANIHGKQNPYSADDVSSQFSTHADQPDLILDSGTLPPTPPSTVIDLTKDGGKAVRKGSLNV